MAHLFPVVEKELDSSNDSSVYMNPGLYVSSSKLEIKRDIHRLTNLIGILLSNPICENNQ